MKLVLQTYLRIENPSSGRAAGMQVRDTTAGTEWWVGPGYGMGSNFSIGYGSSQSAYPGQSKLLIDTSGHPALLALEPLTQQQPYLYKEQVVLILLLYHHQQVQV